MDNDEYARVQHLVIACAVQLRACDLAAFLERAERAGAVGAVLDPTLYRAAAGELAKVERLARRAQDLALCELPAYVERPRETDG